MKRSIFCGFFQLSLMLLVSGCNLRVRGEQVAPTQVADTVQVSLPTPIPSETPFPIPSATATVTQTATAMPLPTETLTPAPTPTYAILRGKILQRANCRYGPGAPYLYKYGITAETNMQMIGRNPDGTWVMVQAIGGDNPCWVKAELVDIKGDVMALEPLDPDVILPWSPYYGALRGVSATREGSKVMVFWSPLNLRVGDDSEQTPYLIEAWVCQGGQIVFTVVGSYQFAAEVIDEAGCSEPSHARIYGAEKHGYTVPVEVPWPAQ